MEELGESVTQSGKSVQQLLNKCYVFNSRFMLVIGFFLVLVLQ